jgi:hypothetical protein
MHRLKVEHLRLRTWCPFALGAWKYGHNCKLLTTRANMLQPVRCLYLYMLLAPPSQVILPNPKS